MIFFSDRFHFPERPNLVFNVCDLLLGSLLNIDTFRIHVEPQAKQFLDLGKREAQFLCIANEP